MIYKINFYKSFATHVNQLMIFFIDQLLDKLDNSISIQQRFTQGPVFVLGITILPTKVSSLIKCLKGNEDAEHYDRAVDSLKALNCSTTVKALETDIMSNMIQVVKGKLITLLPAKLNEECKGGELEMECIALEDDEQAKWLFNFLEFNAEMMKEAKI